MPATDAPNVNGARDLGYAVGQGNDGAAGPAELRTAVEAGRVKALYVLDPGPDGSLGDVVLDRRGAPERHAAAADRAGRGDDASWRQAADIVLPGAAFVEKDAIYTNDQGRVQAASRAIAPPGEAREDWQILVERRASLGLTLPYKTSNDVRRALAAAMPGTAYARGRQDGVHAAGSGAQLAAGVEPVRAVEVGLHVPGPAAGEGAQRADGRAAARRVDPVTSR